MTAYVICANDSIRCVVVGTEGQANAKRDECKAAYRASEGRWLTPGQLDAIYWHWHEVDLYGVTL